VSGSNHRCATCGRDFMVMCGSPAVCCGDTEQPISPLRWICTKHGQSYDHWYGPNDPCRTCSAAESARRVRLGALLDEGPW
jgi:hypothetical protein